MLAPRVETYNTILKCRGTDEPAFKPHGREYKIDSIAFQYGEQRHRMIRAVHEYALAEPSLFPEPAAFIQFFAFSLYVFVSSHKLWNPSSPKANRFINSSAPLQ